MPVKQKLEAEAFFAQAIVLTNFYRIRLDKWQTAKYSALSTVPRKSTSKPKPKPESQPEPASGRVIDPGMYKDKTPKREPYNVPTSPPKTKKLEASQ